MRGTTVFARPQGSDALFERVIETGFLSDEDLEIFHTLTKRRRSLPLYLGGFWRCYECDFESSDLAAMGTHILETHDPASVTARRRVLQLIDRERNRATPSAKMQPW